MSSWDSMHASAHLIMDCHSCLYSSLQMVICETFNSSPFVSFWHLHLYPHNLGHVPPYQKSGQHCIPQPSETSLDVPAIFGHMGQSMVRHARHTLNLMEDTFVTFPNFITVDIYKTSQSQRYITTDSKSASPSWCQAPIWDLRRILPLLSLNIFRQLRFFFFERPNLFAICNNWCGATSLARRRVCSFQLLPGIDSTVFLRSEPHGTHKHILLSLFFRLPHLLHLFS
jgi:hypothetical protein